MLNVSSRQLDEVKVNVLRKGLQFAVVPKSIPKLNIVSSTEEGIWHLDTCNKDLIRAELTKYLQ